MAEPLTLEDYSRAMSERVSNTIIALRDVYLANDPAQSKSGSDFGVGRRTGRQDAAVQAISLLLGLPEPGAESKIRWMIAEGIL